MRINPEVSEHATYAEVRNWASSFLEKIGKEAHAATWLMRERLHWTPTDMVMNSRKIMPEKERTQFLKDLEEHAEGKLVQQIIGHEWFYDRQFKVTADTLIPRPETEEWFHRYVKELPEHSLDVVDIGTGSGVLGISHKLERPQDQVLATDISEAALDVAKENAKRLEAEVTYLCGDLTAPLEEKKVDILVSNPPYIGESEKEVMDESVIKYEPHQALFAEEEGLYLYRRLAKEAPHVLKKNGQVFVEIGYKQGSKVAALFKEAFPQAEVVVWTDFSGNERVVHVKT